MALSYQIKNLYNQGLKHQKEMAFLLEEARWRRSASKRNECFRSLVENLPRNHSLKEVEVSYLGSALLFLREGLEEQPLFAPPVLSRELCSQLAKKETQISKFHHQQLFELQKEILSESRQNAGLSHAARRQALDGVIKTLLTLPQEAKSALDSRELGRILARAYLYRSRIIRPKGFTVPAKKKEGLANALKQLEEPYTQGTSNGAEYYRLKGLILLEQAAIAAIEGGISKAIKEDLKNALLKLAQNWEAQNDLQEEDIKIVLGQARLNRNDRSYVNWVQNHPRATALDQAWAAWLLSTPDNGLVNKAIQEVKEGRWISDPAWESLTQLLGEMAQNNAPNWQDLVTTAWQACHEKENRLFADCYLRWYWSRQADLYDLAFHAASDDKQKVLVADSLKSRPALRWQVFEELMPELVEIAAQSLVGLYIADLPEKEEKLRKAAGVGKEAEIKSQDFGELPDGWIAVHFYLSTGALPAGRDKGYALIYNGTEWTQKEFFISPLWEAFWQWTQTYALAREEPLMDWTLGPARQAAAEALQNLCLAVGREMPFLFEHHLFPNGTPVVFIPHGFLHRIPLHMAIEEGGGVWAGWHPSTYLPAWHLWQPGKIRENEDKRALVNLEDTGWPSFSSGWTVTRPAGSTDFQNITGVGRLAVLCHGRGHYTNPFASRLLLADGGATLKLLMQTLPPLNGAQVLLGACEADLMAPQGAAVDEHLSLSTAFLQRGASEILGGLYEVQRVVVEELIDLIDNSGTGEFFHNLLWKWQQNKISSYLLENSDPVLLYFFAPFRTIGLAL